MGCGASAPSAEFKASMERSKALDKIGRNIWTADQSRVKLLLLGAGESGKSTIFKQMKILYGDNFSDEEREAQTSVVYSNILGNMRLLVKACDGIVPAEDSSLVDAFKAIPENDEVVIDSSVADTLRALWNDAGVKQTWARRAEFQIQDSLAWYVGELSRISAPGYVPSVDDILRARVRTSGIVEETYKIDNVDFVMYDVGGQRNERKKWIHCFDLVTAVIFVAAISEYDQVLYEDSSMGRMDEAVLLFDEICNSKYFVNTAMILYLNKKDLFREKLLKSPVRIATGGEHDRYVDFKGPYAVLAPDEASSPGFEAAYDAACDYFLNLFTKRNFRRNKEVYHHITCATDTENAKIVFSATKDIILKQNLKGSGFMD